MSVPQLSLAGKVALVTGASRGIGLGIAALFSQAGARVLISSRKQSALEAAARDMPGEVAVFAANAGDPGQAQACVRAAVERFGAIDVLVNNAAANPYFGPMVDVDLERWQKTVDVNLRGTLVFVQAAWRAWMREHGGAVINVASTGALQGDPELGIYNTTKAGMLHMTRLLAAELLITFPSAGRPSSRPWRPCSLVGLSLSATLCAVRATNVIVVNYRTLGVS